MPVNLKSKKRLVSRIVGVGVNRVRFDNDHLDDVADAIAGGTDTTGTDTTGTGVTDATLTGTWTVSGYQDQSGEDCDSTLWNTTLFNGGTAVFTTTGLTMNTPMNIGVEEFCILFLEGSVDGNTCTVAGSCDCEDDGANDIEGCDYNATTESACTSGGGEWDVAEIFDMTDADFVTFLANICVDEDGPCGGGAFNSTTSTCVTCDEDRTYVIEIIDSMTLTMTDDEGTDTATYSISGNTLTFTISDTSDDGENQCAVWTFTKN